MDKKIIEIYALISTALKSGEKSITLEINDLSLEDFMALQNGLEEHYGFKIDVKTVNTIQEILIVDFTTFQGDRNKKLKPVAFLNSFDYQYLESERMVAKIIPFPNKTADVIRVDFKNKKVLV